MLGKIFGGRPALPPAEPKEHRIYVPDTLDISVTHNGKALRVYDGGSTGPIHPCKEEKLLVGGVATPTNLALEVLPMPLPLLLHYTPGQPQAVLYTPGKSLVSTTVDMPYDMDAAGQLTGECLPLLVVPVDGLVAIVLRYGRAGCVRHRVLSVRPGQGKVSEASFDLSSDAVFDLPLYALAAHDHVSPLLLQAVHRDTGCTLGRWTAEVHSVPTRRLGSSMQRSVRLVPAS